MRQERDVGELNASAKGCLAAVVLGVALLCLWGVCQRIMRVEARVTVLEQAQKEAKP